uniref:Uncharacterized protein n=1 Tax=Mycena chlorophos TaxID=658473 RepID=A0ABQ0LQS1_MYCCL|nr:predicted protein [Mycena chlorophos]
MVTGREQLTNDEREGLVAYAVSQSDTFHNLARRAKDSATQPRIPKGARRPRFMKWYTVLWDGVRVRGRCVEGGFTEMEDDVVGEQIEQQVDEMELGNASDEEEEEEED